MTFFLRTVDVMTLHIIAFTTKKSNIIVTVTRTFKRVRRCTVNVDSTEKKLTQKVSNI